MRFVVLAWSFGAVWLYTITGAAFTQFAKLLGMSKFGFGILAALPFAGCLFQLPVSYFIERYGHRKRLFIGLGAAHRALWLVVAAIPWVLPVSLRARGMIAVVALSWSLGQMIGPAWVSWMADLVPERIRGRYFSRRAQIGQLIGLVATLLIGFVLDHAEATSLNALLRVTSMALAISGLFGVADFLWFLPVTEPVPQTTNRNISWKGLLLPPLRDPNFRHFLGFTALLTFSTGYINQFVWLYVLDVGGFSNTAANAMLILAPLIVFMVMYPVWGELTDKIGRKPVLIISMALYVQGAVSWVFISKEHWLAGFAAVTLGTIMWPGLDVANFNVLLDLSTATEGQRERGAHVAINSAVIAVSGILSGVFGGLMAGWLENWKGSLFGYSLTYHGVLFIIASGVRLVAVFWLLGLKEPDAYTTRAALRYLGASLYSNLQQAAFIPGRVLWQFRRWTYKITPRQK